MQDTVHSSSPWLPLIKPFLAISLALCVSSMAALSWADYTDSMFGGNETDETKLEVTDPTPVQELSPTGDTEALPGTEPLYDQGVMVTQIEIEGNDHVPIGKVMEILDTKPGSLYSKKRLQKDLKKLYESGYFTENLRAVPVATKDGIRVKYVVEENPLVQSISFSGNTLIESSEILPLFREQIGLPQNANLINKAVAQVEELYQKKGYVLARVDDIQEPETGKVVLTINEGKIASISFDGNYKTKDFVLKRALAQKEGEFYNENVIADDMKRIFSIQAFTDVRRVIKASADKPGEYDLTIELDEKKTGTISLGGGVDTGTGLFGTVGYSDVNFRGHGENMSTSYSLGTGVIGSSNQTLRRRIMQFQSSWFNPSIGDSLVSIGASVFARELGSFNVPLAIERRIGGELNLGAPIKSLPGVSYGSGFGYESIHIKEGVSQARLDQYNITAAQRERMLRDGDYAYATPTLAIDTRNNRMEPTSGWYNTIGSKFAAGLKGPSYGQVSANFRRYLTITDDLSLSANVQGGTNVLGDIPQFDMFRLGGNYTIRGFQEGAVGTGQSYLMGSTELRAKVPYLKRFTKYPFYDILSFALFADAGKMYQRAETDALFGRPGYGIAFGGGIRLNLPAVGALRFDYGVPVGGNKGTGVRNINFGVGQKF